jgi:hypothetical protein
MVTFIGGLDEDSLGGAFVAGGGLGASVVGFVDPLERVGFLVEERTGGF